jgi:hypothetical protein
MDSHQHQEEKEEEEEESNNNNMVDGRMLCSRLGAR